MDMVDRAEEVLSASPRKLLQHLAPVLLGSADASAPSTLGNGAKRVRALRSLAKAAAECGDLQAQLHSRLELCTLLVGAAQPPAPGAGKGGGASELLVAELTKLAHLLHDHRGRLPPLVPLQPLVSRLQGGLLGALQRAARALPSDGTAPVRGGWLRISRICCCCCWHARDVDV